MKKTFLFIIIAVSFIGIAAWKLIPFYLSNVFSFTDYSSSRTSYTSPFKDDQYLDIDTEALLEQNSDYAAWLYYEELGISLPIVQENYENEYLDKNFDNEEDSDGTLFVQYDSSSDFSQMNTFIFGTEDLLSALVDMYDTSEYDNPYFYIYTSDGRILEYRVFSVYLADSSSNMYQIPVTEEALSEYIETALDLGDISDYVEFEYNESISIKNCENIVTLVTALNSSKRLFVQGILIDES